MKKLVCLFIILFSGLGLKAQDSYYSPFLAGPYLSNYQMVPFLSDSLNSNYYRPLFTYSASVAVGDFPGAVISNSLSTDFFVQPAPKWSFQLGGGIGLHSFTSNQFNASNTNSFWGVARANYHINPNLTLAGEGFIGRTSMPILSPLPPLSSSAIPISTYGGSLILGYKFSENFQIEGRFTKSYSTSPFTYPVYPW